LARGSKFVKFFLTKNLAQNL